MTSRPATGGFFHAPAFPVFYRHTTQGLHLTADLVDGRCDPASTPRGFSPYKKRTRTFDTLLLGWRYAAPWQVSAIAAFIPGIICPNVQGANLQTPMPPPPAVNGGLVQQDLFAAYELLTFFLRRLAAHKRYSLKLTDAAHSQIYRFGNRCASFNACSGTGHLHAAAVPGRL